MLCREEAQDLCGALAAASTPLPVIGVVKEAEAEPPVEEGKELGVEEFASKYFCGPLYQCGPEREIYAALGNAPIFTLGGLGKALINPFGVRRQLKEMGKRLEAKKVEGNMRGDGLTKGGVLVIAPDSSVRHVFYEDPGNGIPAEELAAIVSAATAVQAEAAALA